MKDASMLMMSMFGKNSDGIESDMSPTIYKLVSRRLHLVALTDSRLPIGLLKSWSHSPTCHLCVLIVAKHQRL
jgi:hypothetical protein